MTPAVTADVHVAVGGFSLDATFDLARSEVLAVVGPNGAGKSTLLRTIAGVIRPTSGSVSIDGTTVDDTSTFIPAFRRSIGYVPQDGRLFPFTSALDNVAFGPRRAGQSKRDARRIATEVLATLDLDELRDRSARSLSGGEARRVAIARALARKPSLLLLDEPFAGLDVEASRDTRAVLRSAMSAHDGATVFVTHDPAGAMSLANRFLVLEGGRVTQLAARDEIRRSPRSRYAADFVGVNHLEGRVVGGRIIVGPEGSVVAAEIVAAEIPADASDVAIVIHPRAIALHRQRPEGSPRNVWAGTIAAIDDEGERVRVSVDGAIPLVADVTPDAVRELALVPGAAVYVSVKANEVSVEPR
ncbi:MAG: ABC transporter ATP-binding protein [Actinomycetota bacterium]